MQPKEKPPRHHRNSLLIKQSLADQLLCNCQGEVKDKIFFILSRSDLRQKFQCRAHYHGQSSL